MTIKKGRHDVPFVTLTLNEVKGEGLVMTIKKAGNDAPFVIARSGSGCEA